MSIVSLNYGIGVLDVYIPDSFSHDVIKPTDPPSNSDQLACVHAAINHPINDLRLPPLTADTRVAIGINDKTRPVPYPYLLPPLLSFLTDNNVKCENIVFICATGTHLPMTSEEMASILPAEIVHNYRIISHNCDDHDQLVFLGTTKYGTNVEINRTFHEADVKIVVGNIEPHHFMGFSGGNKTAAIGLVGRETINHNHSFLVSEMASTGVYDNNPCRMDVEEIGDYIGVDLALNAILNHKKGIVHCLFGHPRSVIREGIPLSRAICQQEVHGRYDFVIASAGGYPKDINLYQAQKAITNASMITKPGGTILLIAECKEGVGSNLFLDFMSGITSPDQALEKFSKIPFQICPHKAFKLAKQAKNFRIHLVSSMQDDLVKQLFLNPIQIKDLPGFIMDISHQSPTTAVMTNAVATIPYLVYP